MADEEDENKKDWGKEKNLSKTKPKKNKNKRVDDGLVKERRTHQWMEALVRVFQVLMPINTLINNHESRLREGIIHRFQLNELRQRFEQIERQNHRIVLELDKATLETRRAKLQLENHKATAQLKLERAELETEKVRFQGQKEKAEQLIEMLKMKQELQQVRRDNQVKSVEIARLQERLNIQPNQTHATNPTTGLSPTSGISYMSSGLQFLAMQQNTQVLQGLMPHRNHVQRPPRNRLSAQGGGFCVCAECMLAEFPNTLEGQRLLEAHLNSEHPQRGALTGPPEAGSENNGSGWNNDTTDGKP